MSRKFYAVNRETGERWKSDPSYNEYLVMYDSEYLAVVTDTFYMTMRPLDPKIWKKVVK